VTEKRGRSSLVRWWVLAVMLVALPAALIGTLAAGFATPSLAEILSGIESENNRRQVLLKEYSGSRQYTLSNIRFGKQAAVAVRMNYREVEGERYTVLMRSGSGRLNDIIDRVLVSEAVASLPAEQARHQITAANYRVRLLGTESAAGRNCYLLELEPRVKNRFLIVGKAWVDAGSYAVVRVEGQFSASLSVLVGAPHIREEFIEVHGFWLPSHVRSISSSLLLGPSELDILFSGYEFVQDSALLQ
jgi:outer membrane lipoprotein-sorting protein